MKKEKTANAKECYLHGEAMIFSSELPADAQEMKPSSKGYHIIADSETTGNHHVLDMKPGVKLFKSGNRTFMKNSKPTNVRCVHADRHDAITINPGTWEVGIQEEYDHYAQLMRQVRD